MKGVKMGPVNKNYVKFVRGSKAAYDALPAKSPETLYFIYESAEADSGQLYLGEKLILGGSVEQITSLKDVADIAIGEDLANKDLLVYNSKTKKWENVTSKLSDIDTSKLHYVRVPENHIVIDFDIPDDNGNKCFEKCNGKYPQLVKVSPTHYVSCYLYDEVNHE